LDKISDYKNNWIQHVDRMQRDEVHKLVNLQVTGNKGPFYLGTVRTSYLLTFMVCTSQICDTAWIGHLHCI